jgi:hypothetical protein
MNDPTIRFPVCCPQCGSEALAEYPITEVAVALIASNPLRLSAPCHGLSWDASPVELEQIREYLAASIVKAQKS